MTKRMLAVFVASFGLFGAACATTPATSGTREIAVKAGSTPAFVVETINGNFWAVPADMDIKRYPILGRKLTEGDQIRLGVRLDRLAADTVLFNEDRARRAFRVDVIPAGTKVWIDREGNPVYKTDCGNRVMRPVNLAICPATVTCNGPNTADSIAASGGAVSGKSWTDRLWDLLKFLLPLFLLFLLLALIIWALWRLIENMVEYHQWRQHTPPVVPPVPPVAPRPRPAPPVAPPAPVVPVVPVRTTTTRHYGPFKTVNVEDRGPAGFRVVGDGTEVGVFTNPVNTEDAGLAGHYVVVTETA